MPAVAVSTASADILHPQSMVTSSTSKVPPELNGLRLHPPDLEGPSLTTRRCRSHKPGTDINGHLLDLTSSPAGPSLAPIQREQRNQRDRLLPRSSAACWRGLVHPTATETGASLEPAHSSVEPSDTLATDTQRPICRHMPAFRPLVQFPSLSHERAEEVSQPTPPKFYEIGTCGQNPKEQYGIPLQCETHQHNRARSEVSERGRNDGNRAPQSARPPQNQSPQHLVRHQHRKEQERLACDVCQVSELLFVPEGDGCSMIEPTAQEQHPGGPAEVPKGMKIRRLRARQSLRSLAKLVKEVPSKNDEEVQEHGTSREVAPSANQANIGRRRARRE